MYPSAPGQWGPHSLRVRPPYNPRGVQCFPCDQDEKAINKGERVGPWLPGVKSKSAYICVTVQAGLDEAPLLKGNRGTVARPATSYTQPDGMAGRMSERDTAWGKLNRATLPSSLVCPRNQTQALRTYVRTNGRGQETEGRVCPEAARGLAKDKTVRLIRSCE